MVKGLDTFRKYFADYEKQYVLIGGAACDIEFESNETSFRATRDLDMVLIIEALTPEFGGKLWQFILDGKYRNKSTNGGKPQFYIEEEKIQQGFLRIRGWAVADCPVKIQIFDENKEKIQAEILRTERVDVEQMYEEMDHEDKTGFFAELTNLTGKVVYVVFYAGETKSVHVVNLQPTVILRKKIEKYAQKGMRYWKSQGSAALAGKIANKIKTASTRNSVPEMDRASSSGRKGTGAPEERKIRISAKDQYCDSAVQNTGEISPSACRDCEGTDLSELGTLSFRWKRRELTDCRTSEISCGIG